MTPIIGSDGAAGVSIDLERLLTSRLLVTAQSGGGKSWALRRLAEQTAGQVQQLIIDPEGEFYTLREKHPYIVAGKDGDCPAHPRSAAVLARRLLELRASAILDVYELSMDDRRRFVREFLTALINAPKSLWGSALILLDEAHEFAPQSGQSLAADAVAALVTRGRKRGFAGVLATQRIAALDKNVVAQVGNKLIGKATLDLDVRRSLEELGLGRGQASTVRRLSPGEFYAYGPAFGLPDAADGVAVVKVGSVETSHPRPGALQPPVSPAPAEIAAALDKLAALDAEAADEERTREQLERRIAELESRGAARPDPSALEAEFQRGRAAGAAEEARRREPLEAIAKALANGALGPLLELQQRARSALQAPPSASGPAAAPDPPPVVRRKSSAGNVSSGSGQARMLAVLASRAPAKLTRAQVGTLARLRHTGGTFSTYLSRLKTEGLVAVDGDLLYATEDGIRAAGAEIPAPQTTAEVQRMWLEALPGKPAEMLERLIATYPREMTRGELAEAVGITASGGTFSTYLSKLSANGLVEKRGRAVRAAATLWTEPR